MKVICFGPGSIRSSILKHELVQLPDKIDWDWIDSEITTLYSDQGPPRDSDPLCDRASAAQAHLWIIRRGRVRALGL